MLLEAFDSTQIHVIDTNGLYNIASWSHGVRSSQDDELDDMQLRRYRFVSGLLLVAVLSIEPKPRDEESAGIIHQ